MRRHLAIRLTAVLLLLLLLAGGMLWRGGRTDAPPRASAPLPAPAEGEPRRSSSRIAGPDLASSVGAHDTGRDWFLVVTVEEDGEPIRGQDVRVLLWVEGLPDWNQSTDRLGQVRIGPFLPPLPTAGFEVNVETKTHDSEPYFARALPAEDGSNELRATLQLSAVPSVSGWVELPEGVPPEHAYVWIHRHYMRNHDYHEIQGLRLRLDAEGRFYTKVGLDEDSGDTFGVEVSIAHKGKRWYGYRGGTAPASGLEIPVGPLRPGDPAILRVQLQTPQGLSPAIVHTLWAQFDNALQCFMGYTADGLEEEDALCFLWQPGTQLYLQAGVHSPEGLGHVAVGPLSAEATDVELLVPPARVLRGSVRRPDGKGVPGVKLSAKLRFATQRGRPIGWYEEAVETDGEGAFELGGLGPHPYVVSARAEASVGTVRPQAITAEQSELQLVLRPSRPATVRVLDAAGRPIEGVTVRLSLPPYGVLLDPAAAPLTLPWFNEFEELPKRRTDENGEAEFEGLDGGRDHRLQLQPPRSRPELDWVELQGWRPRDQTFHLDSGLTISGRVLLENGQAARDLYVRVRPLDVSTRIARRYRRLDGSEFDHLPTAYVHPDFQGTFALGPLPAGRYAIQADGGPEVIAAAGDEGVVLNGVSPGDQIWLTIRVPDWRPADRGAFALLGATGERIRALPVSPGGALTFPHVGVGERPDLWIGGLAGGRYVWLQDLRFSESDGESEMEASALQGGTISGRLEAPAELEVESWHVEAVGPLLRLDQDGRATGGFPCAYGRDGVSFELSGVPPGSWSITVTGKSKERTHTGSAKARAGEAVVVELRR